MFFDMGDGEESKASTSSSIQPPQPCHHFEFPEILIATENFDESLVIGRGGFGKVYKGKVSYGSSQVVVAVKRLDSKSNQGVTEFWAEVEMLSVLRHCNLVSLIGYCNHENEMILVYEYMPNGTLDDHLHKLHTSLSWIQRLNICIGAGRGLHYLHTGTGIESGVIHRDVKSSNILLTESWAAKVSDFGLSKVGPTNQPSTYVNTLVKGTFGYLDPNYYATGKLTRKSDVYAFGVVLLELLCRKRAVDRSLGEEQYGLVAWVQDSIKEGNIKDIVDSDIRGEISQRCLREFVRIVERCLQNSPKHRPTMAEIVASLESLLALQEKSNNSLNSRGTTIFGRMVNVFPFLSSGENPVFDRMVNLFPFSLSREDSILARVVNRFSFSSSGEISAQDVSRLSSNKMLPEMEGVPAHFQGLSPSLKVFEFEVLKKATKKFSQDLMLGEAAFGEVFLGWVEKNTLAPSNKGVGLPIAVKRFYLKSAQAPDEWLTEVNFLGHMTHPNIIGLLGYCQDEPEHLLVYEHMPNKSLDRFLFKDSIAKPLTWEKRILILLGVACGLTYLHSREIILRDLQSSHILLDEDFNAKLGGFGLVKYCPLTKTHVNTRVMGTYGYGAPEYITTGRLSRESDIYSFGLLLLESMTGQRVMDLIRRERQQSLLEWVNRIQSDKRKLKKIMDPRLKNKYPSQGASEYVSLAMRCIAHKPQNRPSSEEVLDRLEQIYALNK
ncbi:hypothetical protein SSX86_010175 [Deinandra increscens subsp. villosa]|uniref:Protein kinase domain-containing protein n=1 Tax=Deinandra increscens subsp. villosa TaxID=3103831 RepID=A0AAP0H275_9ASTR